MPSTHSGSSSNKHRFVLAGLLAALLLACLAAALYTRERGAGNARVPQTAESAAPLVDDKLLRAAQQLLAAADTPAEQTLGRAAVRLADHELDEAFAMALAEATAPAPPAGWHSGKPPRASTG